MTNKTRFLILISLFACSAVWAQFQMPGPMKPSQARAKKMTTLTHFTQSPAAVRMDGLEYDKDVVYSHASDMDLHLQVIRPDSDTKRLRPVVVYIPGSAWFKQNCYAGIPNLKRFASRGYVVISVEYRPSTTAIYPAQLQDVKTAVRFIRRNAALLGIDVNNVFIWGDSSGGNMSLLETLTQDHPELDAADGGSEPLTVNACVAYYPVTDILALRTYSLPSMDHESGNSPEGVLFGHVKILENADLIQTASPVTYLSKKKARTTAPILLMAGNSDRVVPFEQSVEMADKLQDLGYRYVFYKVEGGDHGSWQFWTPEAFDIVDNFFKRYLRK